MPEGFRRSEGRQLEITERNFAETILGYSFTAKVYSIFDGIGRGTISLSDGTCSNIHTAYIIGDGMALHSEVSGVAVGVLVDRKTDSVSVVISTDTTEKAVWYQYEIAEAVDYWEHENSPRIYCLNEKSCGAVVFTEESGKRRYVVIRMNSGHCGLPKGHIEKYEDEITAAKREVREEIGVDITVIPNFRMSVEYSISQRANKESVYFLGRFEGEKVTIQESEISSYRLCEYAEARRAITYENDRAVLDAAEAMLSEVTA